MTVTYFKRYKMRIDLERVRDLELQQIEGYSFVRWSSNLLDEHAEAKYKSFRNELDSHVFPCLGNHDGCLKLMNEISCRSGFVPQATWLLVCETENRLDSENCGTVQGISDDGKTGSIQNLGVSPEHRGRGLGTQLLMRSLQGFAEIDVKSVSLEVTAKNEGALQLYQRLGFDVVELVYKSADLKY